ncbi:hypothetical protein Tco_0798404, partial [Tanacetum coccineum]
DGNWKFYRSKEDQTQSISHSIFMTNFPDHDMARNLWKVCNDYGVVVDAFNPYKKSKQLNKIIAEHFEVIMKGSVCWVHAKEMEACDPFICNDYYGSDSSGDEKDAKDDGSQEIKSQHIMISIPGPVNLYDILNKRKDSSDDLKYPPGFTPIMINVEEVNEKEKEGTSNEVNDHVNSTLNKLEESVPKGKLPSNNSVCSKRIHTGGSILELMDELVGQTVGYNMEGCMSNIEVIIGSQGECNIFK